jgi:hypothetical protein
VSIQCTADPNFVSQTSPPNFDPFTLCGWFKLDSTGGTSRTLFARARSAVGARYACFVTSGNISIVANTTSPAGAAIPNDTWFHFGFTVDGAGTTFKTYVNGSLDLTFSDSIPSVGTTDIMLCDDNFSQIIHGKVAYVRAWTTVLTLAEIAAERTSPSAVKKDSLWGDWPLPGINDVTDKSGGGNNMTVQGSPTTNADTPSAVVTLLINPLVNNNYIFGRPRIF